MTTSVFKGNSPLIQSIDDLIQHFREGETPRESWKIGTEHEKMAFARKTWEPVPYEGERGILAVLSEFHTRFGWEPILEGENLIALSRGESSITLEPGGAIELSGAALPTAHDTCRELGTHLREMKEISEELDLVLLTLGRNPIVPSEKMPLMPKARYGIMQRYLPTRGDMALDMMRGTGTVQTNIDYSDEEDMSRKLRAGHALSPFLIALYANSPFAEGSLTGFLSTRSQVWRHTDPGRCGFIPGVLEPGFGYREYAEYALDVPMFFIFREGRYLDYAGKSFRRFMEEGLEGHKATLEDWELHLTTLFPLVRLKQYLELRMADTGPLDMICSFSALTRGLFYDETALGEVEGLLGQIPVGLFPNLEGDAAQDGLRASVMGKPLRDWCADLLDIASAGLNRLDACDSGGENEAKFLSPLWEIVESGKTQADRLLETWAGEWGNRIEPIFESSQYTF